MATSTQVILLERVESLGDLGEVVKVKPGFARNYLLPQGKALRASKENLVYFEAQKKAIEADNKKKRDEAEKRAKKVEGVLVPIIRQASEAGQLFGSVTSRDIATQLAEETKEAIDRSMIQMNQNFKMIGLFPVAVYLHPEVKVEVTVNIARSAEEAKIQAETGKALVADADAQVEEQEEVLDEALADALDDDALQAEKERREEDAKEAAEDAEKGKKKQEKRAAKKSEKAEDEAAEEASEGADSDSDGEEA